MRIALWTGAVLALLALAYFGWTSLSSDAHNGPQLPETGGELGDGEWYDPVVKARVGLFNAVEVPRAGASEVGRLETLGYLQGYEPARALQGVVVHDPGRAQPGYNLYVSAHAPEAYLMTMEGEILHTWRYEFDDACPDEAPEDNFGRLWFRRVELLEGGDLLALFDYAALIKLDRESRLLWARCRAYHHDIEVDSDGLILTLEGRPGVGQQGRKDVPIRVDFITVLDAEGQTLDEVSVLDAIVHSAYRSFADRVTWQDIFHTNSIELLDGPAAHGPEAFRAGNVLVSMRNIDAIAIVDLQAKRVAWGLLGAWRAQHEAVMTGAGSLLLFDNTGRDGRSRVMEIDPVTERVLWSYEGDPADDLYSPVCGSNQRLANGNTLITESTAGRAFEVTPEKTIVWDYRSPHRVAVNGAKLVAMLGDLVRVREERVNSWLGRQVKRNGGS